MCGSVHLKLFVNKVCEQSTFISNCLFHFKLTNLFVKLHVIPSVRWMRKNMTEDNIKDLMGDAHASGELEKEWEQLREDREMARSIFPKGDSKVRERV